MADRQQDVRARLTVEQDGDPGVFDRTADGIDRLGDEARAAQRDLDGVSETLDDAGEASKRTAGGVDALGETVGSLVGRFGKIVGIAALVWESFQKGWEIGERLRGTLDKLTDNRFSNTVKGWSTSLLEFVGVARDVDDTAENLALAIATLEANGRDLANMTDGEIIAAYKRLGQEQIEQRKRTEDLRKAWAKLREESPFNPEKVRAQAAELATLIENTGKLLPHLEQGKVAQLFENEIRAILDQGERLQLELPASFEAAAQGWGILSSSAEANASRHQAAVDSIRQQLGLLTQTTREEFASQVRAIEEVLQSLDLSDLAVTDPQVWDRLKDQLRQIQSSAIGLGKTLPPALIEAASELGVFDSAVLAASGTWEGYTTGADRAAEAVSRIESAAAAGAAATREQANAASDLDVSSEAAALTVDKFAEAQERASQSAVRLKDTTDAAGNRVLRIDDDARRGAEGLDVLGLAGESASQGVGEASASLGTFDTEAELAADKARDAALAVEHFGEAAAGEAGDLEKGAAAVESQAQAIERHGDTSGRAADQVDRLATAQDRAATSSETMLTQVDGLATSTDGLQQTLEALPSAMDAAFAGAESRVQPLVTALRGAQAEADALLSKLTQVANFDGGANA